MYPEEEQHTMQLVETHPSGAEEWACPICDRRIILQWQPNYRRVTLNAGNQNAIHHGNKGGLQMQTAQVAEQKEQILSDELREAIDQFMSGMDLSDW